MKNLIYLFAIVILSSSCATIVPATSNYKVDVSENDRRYQLDKQSIELSKLTDQEKNVAKKLVFDYHSFRISLESLVAGNDSILTRNNKLNNTYFTTNGIVGGLGGLTAIGAVFASWTVIVPIAAGVWNLAGLGIQKNNVAPELEKGNNLKDQYILLNQKFSRSRDLFDLCVTSKSKDEAENYFRQWKTELNKTLDESATLFGVPRMSLTE